MLKEYYVKKASFDSTLCAGMLFVLYMAGIKSVPQLVTFAVGYVSLSLMYYIYRYHQH